MNSADIERLEIKINEIPIDGKELTIRQIMGEENWSLITNKTRFGVWFKSEITSDLNRFPLIQNVGDNDQNSQLYVKLNL
jgi:hypothetical protein